MTSFNLIGPLNTLSPNTGVLGVRTPAYEIWGHTV